MLETLLRDGSNLTVAPSRFQGIREIPVSIIPRSEGCRARSVPPIAITPEITALLARDAVVAFGVSGGKDSQALAVAGNAYLDAIGHRGPRILVHADLGRVEWKDSLPVCEELAAHLGMELMVVRRKAGDMMDRWLGRWKNNVERYADLSCVKLILPWSTPSMRFCTSELKSQVIASNLKKRFPDRDIVSAVGIRRQESTARKKMSVSQEEPRLKRRGNVGFTWNAIIEFEIGDVFASIVQSGLRLHEAYTTFNASRVSCVYCIMSAADDLSAAAACVDNHPLYVEMVELEVASTYGFQGHRWLADTAPHLLSAELKERVAAAKEKAALRQKLEAQIPKHLLYIKGWPTCMPTFHEATLLAQVRKDVASALGLSIKYTTAEDVLGRYDDLMCLSASKQSDVPLDV